MLREHYMMISTKKLRISMMKWIYTILIKKKRVLKQTLENHTIETQSNTAEIRR